MSIKELDPTDFKIPELPIPPNGKDSRSADEAKGFGSGDLEAYIKKQDADRESNTQDHLHKGMRLILWVLVFCLCVAITSFFAHILLPEKWRYLSDEQFGIIQAILTGAVTSKLLSGFLADRFK